MLLEKILVIYEFEERFQKLEALYQSDQHGRPTEKHCPSLKLEALYQSDQHGRPTEKHCPSLKLEALYQSDQHGRPTEKHCPSVKVQHLGKKGEKKELLIQQIKQNYWEPERRRDPVSREGGREGQVFQFQGLSLFAGASFCGPKPYTIPAHMTWLRLVPGLEPS